MSEYQIKDRFVKAHKLTQEEAGGYLWDEKSLPEGLTFGYANHHPRNRTIGSFCARTASGLKVEIGEWLVTYSDKSNYVFTAKEFEDKFEATDDQP